MHCSGWGTSLDLFEWRAWMKVWFRSAVMHWFGWSAGIWLSVVCFCYVCVGCVSIVHSVFNMLFNSRSMCSKIVVAAHFFAMMADMIEFLSNSQPWRPWRKQVGSQEWLRKTHWRSCVSMIRSVARVATISSTTPITIVKWWSLRTHDAHQGYHAADHNKGLEL